MDIEDLDPTLANLMGQIEELEKRVDELEHQKCKSCGFWHIKDLLNKWKLLSQGRPTSPKNL